MERKTFISHFKKVLSLNVIWLREYMHLLRFIYLYHFMYE